MNPSFSWRSIGIILLVLIFTIGAYFYSIRIRDARELAALTVSCEASGGRIVPESHVCACPALFPMFDGVSKSCHDRMGGRVRSREEFNIMNRRFEYASECRGKGNEVYVLDGTPLTFCYPYSWGNTVVTKNEVDGHMQYKIAFVSSTLAGTRDAPTWWFVEGESLPTVPDFKPTCISCLSTSTDATTLQKQLGLTAKGRLVGGMYSSTTMFAAYNDVKKVTLFVAPGIWQTYHLFVRVPYGSQETVDMALQSIWFDEHIY